jgi:hypothetical protein
MRMENICKSIPNNIYGGSPSAPLATGPPRPRAVAGSSLPGAAQRCSGLPGSPRAERRASQSTVKVIAVTNAKLSERPRWVLLSCRHHRRCYPATSGAASRTSCGHNCERAQG